ncbi:hypothetical protein V5O48_018194, partial [Marasmius crinis-equi]
LKPPEILNSDTLTGIMTIGQAPRNPDSRKRPRSPDGDTGHPPRPVPPPPHVSVSPELLHEQQREEYYKPEVSSTATNTLYSTYNFPKNGDSPLSSSPRGFSFPLANPSAAPLQFQSTAVNYSQTPIGAESSIFRNGFEAASEYTLPLDNLDSIWYSNPPASGNTELTYVR